MWFDLFNLNLDETVQWALNAIIFLNLSLIGLEMLVNRICNRIERKWRKENRRCY